VDSQALALSSQWGAYRRGDGLVAVFRTSYIEPLALDMCECQKGRTAQGVPVQGRFDQATGTPAMPDTSAVGQERDASRPGQAAQSVVGAAFRGVVLPFS
jgi:hypothetical protein